MSAHRVNLAIILTGHLPLRNTSIMTNAAIAALTMTRPLRLPEGTVTTTEVAIGTESGSMSSASGTCSGFGTDVTSG